ncbi:uncharacterized protein LOC141588688 [Silene latifolia]|uniref:uncharacterized protein LOC141588688 n=1 Tax=Silene latifolia TaxID=37657 RepID=UPI003D7890CD
MQLYSPPTSSSWYWRKVCQTKDRLAEAYHQKLWSTQVGREYTIAKGYEWLREKGEKVQWNTLVWNKWSAPKHSFLAWIYQHGNMNTNAKLFKLGIRDDNTCCICGCDLEDLEHLFFNCNYSKEVIGLVGDRIGIRIPQMDILRWRLSGGGTKHGKDVLNAVINACIYLIWQQRNSSRMNACILRPSKLVDRLFQELKTRFRGANVDGTSVIRRIFDGEDSTRVG